MFLHFNWHYFKLTPSWQVLEELAMEQKQVLFTHSF